MLVQFSVKNFRSFKEEATLSMVAASIKENEAQENLFKVTDKLSLLKSAVIYGANASGKSNLFYAMQFMSRFILHSAERLSKDIPMSRFKLSSETEFIPASFEIIFIYEGIQYRYGFAVDEERVHAEWLFYVPKKQEVKVFTRTEQRFDLTRHFKGQGDLVKGERVRPNALLLSVSAQFNGKMANKIVEWFSSFNCISGLERYEYPKHIPDLMKDEKGKNAIVKFLRDADMGIKDLGMDSNPPSAADVIYRDDSKDLWVSDSRTKEKLLIKFKTYHQKYNNKGEVTEDVSFYMNDDESEGTQKFFNLSVAFIDTLENGKVLIIDELAARLHPRLVKAICELFNSREKNPRNAQLIFASHNTNILRKDIFRRDQIWFVEKDRFGASELYSLVEYKQKGGKKVRNDASYEKDYLLGRYGGVPCVRDFEAPYGE
ncbi:MAG: ATP-binding protein [Candidatus Omnitrophica bacterium]|nr:ATP-binding protein [Candidatus Omnitrophota bacterium]